MSAPAPHDPDRGEDPRYYAEQLVTYLGNKRQLLGAITTGIDHIEKRTGRHRLRFFDGFAGSGVVSRLFKGRAEALHSNDLEPFAAAVGRSHLANHSEVDLDGLHATVDRLNHVALEAERDAPKDPQDEPAGFIRRLYSPANDTAIAPDDRAFYTNANAARLDLYRQLLDEEDNSTRRLLLGPLLAEASIHANTAGVFKGFYKDRATGRGKFGGSGADALRRITGRIELSVPLLSRFECPVDVTCRDVNELVRELPPFDVAYFDPPYNQHPYGSNYFMLNLLTDYTEPNDISKVSGIPRDWRRSAYNRRATAFTALTDLISNTPADFILLSFNDEGLITPKQLRSFLATLGSVDEMQFAYNTFRGSRNLGNRRMYVTEHLFVLERN